MTEIEKWMRKHYTQENPDTIRCNRCKEVFSNHDRLQILKYHLYDEHEITELDEYPRRYNIKENYEITCLTATCKHCMKKINFAIHGVHILMTHLKIIHPDKYKHLSKGKRSLLWDKFDERGDYATCKECKKKLALNGKSPTTNLQQHLSRCRHLNLDHLNKDELTKIRRRSLVWDKYDVMGNKATCKRCTKKVFIRNLKNPLPNLRYHLYHCYYLNLDQASKDELKKIRRRSRIWDKYDVMDNKAACKECKKILKINGKTDSLKNHFLYCRRLNLGHISKAELKKKRRRSQVWENFDDVEGNMEIVICKHCKREVKLGLSASSRLAGHLRHCRRINLDEDELRKRRRRSQVWEKFDDEEGNMEK